MVKSLTFLAFAAVATAAPQLGLLSGLNGLKPGSKSKSADKASASGEPMPDTLSYNQPLKDDDDDDWKKWVDEDPKDPSETEGSTVGFESDPRTNTTTVLRLTTSTSTTLRQIKSTPTHAYVSTARNEIPAYSTPVTQNNKVESYETPSAKKNEVAEPYQSSTIQRDVQDTYSSSTIQRDVQASYPSSTIQRDVQDSYPTTSVQRDVQDSYQSTSIQRDIQPTPQPYRRRDVPQGYGQAEFSKTSRAAACAVKPSAAVSPMPAVSSAPPAFRQAVESAQPSHESSPSFAAAKESSSPVWSATPYSAPIFKPAVTEEQQSYTTIPAQQQQLTSTITTSLPKVAATTPLADAAVASDAKILVNTLRPASTSTEDVKLNVAYSTQSTPVAQDKVAPTPAPAATTPVSMMLQPLYPTTTGVSNGTMGRPAASTGARSNNTLPEFEGAAASPSSFIAGSVIALAIAALAL